MVTIGLCAGCKLEEIIKYAKLISDREKYSQHYPDAMFGIVSLIIICSFALKFVICLSYFIESYCIIKKIDSYEIATLAKQKLPLGYKVYIASPSSKKYLSNKPTVQQPHDQI